MVFSQYSTRIQVLSFFTLSPPAQGDLIDPRDIPSVFRTARVPNLSMFAIANEKTKPLSFRYWNSILLFSVMKK